ncbi:MAG: hypothetical protein Q9195_008594 [Heterodermia aff. obscurata]
MAHQGIYIPPSDAGQQYYPNPYPHSPALIQPHPSSNPQHGPNQHYPSLARSSSSFMPPPSTLPEDVNKWRNLQPQRPSNLWPRGLTEEQRPFQDRYPQHAQTSPINPYYAQQPTSTTAAAVAPTASFTSPAGSQLGQFQRQHTQSPASTFPSAPPMTAPSLPPASPIKPEAFTPAPAAPAAVPAEPTFQEPKKPSAPQTVNTQQQQQQPATMPSATAPSSNPQALTTPAQSQSPTAAAPSPLEAARVTALLEINRLLLYSIFAIQTPPPKPTAPDTSSSSSSDATKPAPPARPSHQTNPHYTDYMRRLQSNLAYLACIADRPHKPQNPIPPFPAIMETPAQRKAEAEAEGDDERERELRMKYESLKELWPDWKGDVKKA